MWDINLKLKEKANNYLLTLKSVRGKLFLTISITITVTISMLIIINGIVLEKVYFYTGLKESAKISNDVLVAIGLVAILISGIVS